VIHLVRRSLLFVACICVFGICRESRAVDLPTDAVVRPIHPGAWAFSIRRPGDEFACYGVIWNRDQADLKLLSTTPRGDLVRTLQGPAEMAKAFQRDDRIPVAAFNADFYVTTGPFTGATIGSVVMNGQLLRTSERPAMAILDDGRPVILPKLDTVATLTLPDGKTLALTGINRGIETGRNSGQLVLYTPQWGGGTDAPKGTIEVLLESNGFPTPGGETTYDVAMPVSDRGVSGFGEARAPYSTRAVLAASPDRADEIRGLKVADRVKLTVKSNPALPIRELVGGAPVLVTAGKVSYQPKQSEPAHPRTAFGFDDKQCVLLVIDGRQPGYAKGVTMPELAEFMASLKVTDALNLDGGGSSCAWVRGEVINTPSDGHVRPVANGLALMSTAPVGRPANIAFAFESPVRIAPKSYVELKPNVTDERLNPVTASGDEGITFDATGSVAAAADRVTAIQAGPGTVAARLGSLAREVQFVVVDRLAKLEMEPSTIDLVPGQAATYSLVGRDDDGRPVIVNGSSFDLTLADNVETVPADPKSDAKNPPQIRGTKPGTVGTLTATALGRTATARVRVASLKPLLTFDEPGSAVKLTTSPEGVNAKADLVAEGSARFARLTWKFEPGAKTQAAYCQVGQKLPRSLGLHARLRGDAKNAYVRVQIIDGNGSALLYDLFSGDLKPEWTEASVKLPIGLKPPLTLRSIYVVKTSDKQAAEGTLDIDDVRVMTLPGEPDGPAKE
jgi:hypothetical protein